MKLLSAMIQSLLLTVRFYQRIELEYGSSNISLSVDPIIFKGLKALTLGDSQQQSLLRLAAKGISVGKHGETWYIRSANIEFQVYSPHTAIDAAPGGLGDWLADIVTGTPVTAPEHQSEEQKKEAEEAAEIAVEEEEDPFVEPRRPVYLLQHHPSQRNIKEPDLKL
jgi:hypothetical protein